MVTEHLLNFDFTEGLIMMFMSKMVSISSRMAQFPEIPVTVISNFQLKFPSKSTILFQILQTRIMTIGDTTNTKCPFSFKQYNLFYSVQKHEICPFMETVPRVQIC